MLQYMQTNLECGKYFVYKVEVLSLSSHEWLVTFMVDVGSV